MIEVSAKLGKSGLLRDFSNEDKKCKNGKRLSVTFLHFYGFI